MRAVLQRVSEAQVAVDAEVVGRISAGLVVLLAVASEDTHKDVAWMKRKILNLRIFSDEQGRLERSLSQVGGELLIVSQFTLYGDCRKGNRPSYTRSASPDQAQQLYRQLVDDLQADGVTVATGRFQSVMQVQLVNDGPVTVILDSKQRV